MAIQDDAIAALAAAQVATRNAFNEFDQRKRNAAERHDYDAYERYAVACENALLAEDKAAKRLIAGILNPKGENVVSLQDATAKLNNRIKKFQQGATTLSDVAAVIGGITQIIMLFSLV